MSSETHPNPTRSRWMDWNSLERSSMEPAKSEPPKPAKPSLVGFDGVYSVESLEIQVRSDSLELPAVLNRTGVRIIELERGAAIGLWSDLDGPEVRAVQSIGLNELPISYLDGSGIPMRYKARRVEGEPVPINVLVEMERHPQDPWRVRTQMLTEMGWRSKGIRGRSSTINGRLSSSAITDPDGTQSKPRPIGSSA